MLKLVYCDLDTNQRRGRRAKILELKSEEQSLVEQQDAAYQDKLRGVLPEDRWMRFDEQLSMEVSDVQHRIRELRDEREPKWEDLKTIFEQLQQGPELYRRSGHAFRTQQLARSSWRCRPPNRQLMQ